MGFCVFLSENGFDPMKKVNQNQMTRLVDNSKILSLELLKPSFIAQKIKF